ncbi:MAG: acetate--CoA ligase alpha subunit [Planctomycetota bacterium]
MFESFFEPASVAVIGASRTPGKVGHDVVRNLLDAGFAGEVYPVNPKAEEVLDLPCHDSVAEVEGEVELAVIAIPAKYVLEAIDDCAEKGIEALIVISAGFKESGEEGAELERRLAEKCRRQGIRCIGPNCLGVISPPAKVNASFGASMPTPGNIAFFSQSGALGTAVLDVAVGENIGMSRFVSYGNKADVDETDLIEALGEDEETSVILGYVESIEDGRKFMDVAGRVTRKKPVVIFKSGRTSAGARAASSHTGSLAGADSAYEAAFKQSGVIRAETVQQFFGYARAFASGKELRGTGVAVVTNAGGPGIIATDAVGVSPLEMAELSDPTASNLKENLPPQASAKNPVDVLGDAHADRYEFAIDAVREEESVSAILTILTPQTSTEPESTARALAAAASRTDKPVLASFMGRQSVDTSWDILKRHGVPNFEAPDEAVEALRGMLRYGKWLETEPAEPPEYDFDRDAVRATIEEARSRGRRTLGEREARSIAAACGIPLPASEFAADEDEAAEAAEGIGYPVVVKISSEDILHKSDAGGVKVGLESAEEVRAAWDEIMQSARDYDSEAALDGVLVQQMAPTGREIIVGLNRDPQFGPVIMFGLGGIYVEVLKDVTFRVAPLGPREAREMMEEIRASALLHEFRGEPERDLEAMADVLTRIGRLAVDFPELAECDLNPVMLYEKGEGLMCVDVRFALAEE